MEGSENCSSSSSSSWSDVSVLIHLFHTLHPPLVPTPRGEGIMNEFKAISVRNLEMGGVGGVWKVVWKHSDLSRAAGMEQETFITYV